MNNKTNPSILVALLFLLFAACSKDESTEDTVVYSFEYSGTTNHYTNPDVAKCLGIRAKTGELIEFDNKYYNYVNENNQDRQCDLYIEPTTDALYIVVDDFNYSKANRDFRPRFVYSTFTGDIDKINHPSELPSNLPENLEYSFDYDDKSTCYVFYPIIEYTTPQQETVDFSVYKGKYKIGKPQFMLQLTEVKKYDYQYNATTKFECADYKFRTKHFEYK